MAGPEKGLSLKKVITCDRLANWLHVIELYASHGPKGMLVMPNWPPFLSYYSLTVLSSFEAMGFDSSRFVIDGMPDLESRVEKTVTRGCSANGRCLTPFCTIVCTSMTEKWATIHLQIGEISCQFPACLGSSLGLEKTLKSLWHLSHALRTEKLVFCLPSPSPTVCTLCIHFDNDVKQEKEPRAGQGRASNLSTYV